MSFKSSKSSSASNLHLQSESSVEALLSFMEWSQGTQPIEKAIQLVVKCCSAQSGTLTRIRLESMRSRILGVSMSAEKRVGSPLSLAGKMVAEDIGRLKRSRPALMSQLEEQQILRDMHAHEWMVQNGIVDAGFVCLERNAREADFLELHFVERPDPAWDTRTLFFATALSRIYVLRRPGLVTDAFSSVSRDNTASLPDLTQILGIDNPAGLTQAEFRIAVLVARGLTPKILAEELDVSITTVRTHLRNIYDKSGVTGFNQLSQRLMSSVEQGQYCPAIRISA